MPYNKHYARERWARLTYSHLLRLEKYQTTEIGIHNKKSTPQPWPLTKKNLGQLSLVEPHMFDVCML
uniref:Uncharacterized protein n=1 Tax=Romanomermis culicivorax TaxID=13658 RepID=A0A915IKR7_ROMCU